MYVLTHDKALINCFILNNGVNYQTYQNDETFMRDVIIVSSNKKFFKLCSRELKLNMSFLLFVIEKFIDDEEFVDGIIMNFFANINNNIKSREFRILLARLYDTYELEYLEKYSKLAEQIYLSEKEQAKKHISKVKSLLWRLELGMGFILMENFNHNSRIITSYLAKQMLKEIFTSIDVEKDLHAHYKNADAVLKYGINNYLLFKISQKDFELAKYVRRDVSFINEYYDIVNMYLRRWNNYNSVVATNYLLTIDKEYHNYNDASLTKSEIIDFIIKELELKEIFNSLKTYPTLNEELDSINLDSPTLLVSDVIFLYNLKKKMEIKKACNGTSNKKLVKVNFEKNK